MTDAIDITVSIVNWNTGPLLANCLDAINQNKGKLRLQLIVVDNNSHDASLALTQQRFPTVTYISNTGNPGFAAANNQALTLAKGKYFLMLNPDTVLHPGSLQALWQFGEAHPRSGAIGARLLNEDGSWQPSYYGYPTTPRTVLRDHLGWSILGNDPLANLELKEPAQVSALMGACILFRCSAIDQIGLMDERFFLVYEEGDWLYRLEQAGWEIWFNPTAMVTHLCGRSTCQLAGGGYRETMRSMKYYLHKHFGLPAALGVSSVLIALCTWRLVKTEVKGAIIGRGSEYRYRRMRFGNMLIGLLT